MLLRLPPAFWKVFGVLFTAIIAPISVKHFEEFYEASKSSTPAEHVTAPSARTPVIRITAQGSGSTPEAAFQNAIATAIQEAIIAEVNVFDWKRNWLAYLKAIRPDGIAKTSQELSCVSNGQILGRVFRSQVIVEMDGDVLRQRIQQVRRDRRGLDNANQICSNSLECHIGR